MNKGTLLACVVDKITTLKDKSVKITLDTQELSPMKAGELFSLMNKVASVYISPAEINQKEMDQVDKIDPEFEGKTQSQRLRGVLFILWQQKPEGYKDFDTFYRARTEQIIDQIKAKLNP